MFQKAELKRLRAQKELLLMQSRANRLMLAAEWQQIRSPDRWREELEHWVQRHPVLTAALAAFGGAAAVRAVRNPGAGSESPGRLGRWASLALLAWKTIRRRREQP